MSHHVSHLQDDGSVFPPVTPDPPLPPGQEEIEVPDLVPVSTPDGPDRAETSKPETGQSETSQPETTGPDERTRGTEPPD